METTTKPCYGESESGCWFDCARGIYIGDAVIEEAIAHGFKCDTEPTEAPSWQGGTSWTDCEFYCELWDEAEQFMAQFADDGFWFGANESGDWGLWACEEDPFSAVEFAPNE